VFDPEPTDHLITQGRALVRAIEALGTIERLDAEIDTLVYELYGLTEEEMAVVEGRSQGQG
jgi:hypothetical protein